MIGGNGWVGMGWDGRENEWLWKMGKMGRETAVGVRGMGSDLERS